MSGAILLVLAQVASQAPPADPVLLWNEETLLSIRADNTPPPMAARNLAMVHGAVFDAVNAITQTHTHFLVDVRAPEGTSLKAAATVAAHRVLIDLYPNQEKRLDATLRRCLAQVPAGPAKEEAVTLGLFVAEEMLKWRKDDGSARKIAFKPKEGVGLWQPTPPNFRPALLPQWPEVTLFALPNQERFRPPEPPGLGSATYLASYREVKALGGSKSEERTSEQTEIARFWADGPGTVTPPGHWNRIAQEVARQRGTTIAENARLFALLNFALADAGIVCWDCKYRFSVWRPIQAIREEEKEWTSLLETPPFPSYTSGHSSFSGASAAVLESFFGTDRVRFSSTSDGLVGVTRSFSSFRAAADEAGKSRIYGGIHWEFDNSAGLETGRRIGQFISRHWLQAR